MFKKEKKQKDIKKIDGNEKNFEIENVVKEEIVNDQENEIKELAKKSEENLNGWKRCQADFENYKKMQAESQKDFIKYATQNVVLQLIPVLDNFHMSTDHIPEDQKDGGWVVGIMHIQKQLENVLSENGVEEIITKEGDKFNPEIHEAVQDSNKESESSEQEKHELIKKIVMKGYKLNGKVMRPVKVIVG